MIDKWIEQMDAKGHDGKALLKAARGLIDKYDSK